MGGSEGGAPGDATLFPLTASLPPTNPPPMGPGAVGHSGSGSSNKPRRRREGGAPRGGSVKGLGRRWGFQGLGQSLTCG